MSVFVATCPKFLSLLGSFYETMPEPMPLKAELIDPEDVPEPYRELLVHRKDMTSTLQQFHQEPVSLHVLHRFSVGYYFFRHIVLKGEVSGRPMEYGAIRIALHALSEPARREVIECKVPLGGILNSFGIGHRSCPGGFFRVLSNSLMNEVFQMEHAQWLYGRCNCLTNSASETIAEVIEILPLLPGVQANP
jgi:hypothetical protein